jgi:putative inorganic carbon (hco3(-)) transporter
MMRTVPARVPAPTWRPNVSPPASERFGQPAPPPAAIADAPEAPGGLSFFLFCALTFVLVGRPQDYIPGLVPFRLALTLSVLTGLVTLFQHAAGDNRTFRQPEAKVYLLFFATMLAGIPFSMHRSISFDIIVYGYTSNVIFFLLFLTHVNTFQKYRRVLFILVVAATLFSIMGLSQGYSLKGRFFIRDSRMFDPNDMAFVELALLPFTLSVLLGRFGVISKVIALTGIACGVLLLLYTGSRGGILGFLAFGFLFFTLRMGPLKKAHKGVLLIVLAGVIALNANKINMERYLTLTDLSDDYNLSDEFGRKQIWSKGAAIFLRDPLTGVGVGNFAMAIGHKRLEMKLIPRWQEAHNSYVQVTTELGIFGIGTFLMLVVMSVRTLNRLRKQTQVSGAAQDLSVFAAMLLAGSGGLLVGAFFLTMGYSLFFPLFFATTTALRNIAIKEGLDIGGPTAARRGAHTQVTRQWSTGNLHFDIRKERADEPRD